MARPLSGRTWLSGEERLADDVASYARGQQPLPFVVLGVGGRPVRTFTAEGGSKMWW
ncbi:hypothetical protein [Streptomyces melanogenes]|uniref:Uncharacterized protein n=1 Tax=Streptomyces melanogenes TaxID=67326 RepID=A0ABZ1XUJ0_9ACTN|nr:hypothetical protein [Streptomyces melanogenes]